MATFDCNLDTLPMAEKVSTVNASVLGVGTAVVGMEHAVVQTQLETSQKICNNLDSGFYLLMKSQISQKIVAQYSMINSKVALMGQIKKSILSKTSQMQKDFLMIKKRYSKLFRELDKELETRVRELDEPAMKISDTRKTLITNSFFNTPATALLSEKEIQTTKQIALNARLKSKTQKSLDSLSTNIFNTEIYSNKIKNMLKEDPLEKSDNMLVPVIFSKMQSLLTTSSELNQTFISESIENEAMKKTQNFFTTSNYFDEEFSQSESEKSNIKNEFEKFILQDSSSDRVKQTIQKLFEGSALWVTQEVFQVP